MAQNIYINPNAVANAVRGIFSTGDEAGAAERRALLNEDLISERILEARRKRQAAEEAARLGTPEAIESRLPLETGASAAQVRNILRAIPLGDAPQVPGTELTSEQAGPRMPIDSAIVERVRRAAAQQFNPLSRTYPQRVAEADEKRRQGEQQAKLIEDAIAGRLTLEQRNAAAQFAPNARTFVPYRIGDGQVYSQETGRLGSATDESVSRQGLNIARGGQAKATAGAQDALSGKYKAETGLAGARTRQTESRMGFPPSRAGAAGNPERETRLDRQAAERAATARALQGDARDAFIADWMGEKAPKRSEPLPGASAPESVRRQFSNEPGMKGKRLGSYERGKGYIVYDGKRIIGHVKDE